VTPIPFKSADGFPCNVIHVGPARGRLGPLLLVHGAGVRANIFLPPSRPTVAQFLSDAGYDVWLINWRASIDLEPNRWTLAQAAVNDYRPATDLILNATGAKSLKAVIHCQGSTSFMMAIAAGLLPEYTSVVSNAVSLHTIVPALSRIKSQIGLPTLGRFIDYLNPQWGISAPTGWPNVIDWYVRAMHHECNNAVCKHSSFTFGAGFPTLWRHENLDDETHEWLKGEFAHVPVTFFSEMARCIAAGHLVTDGSHPELPLDFAQQKPKTDARFTFLAGRLNACFTVESQRRTYEFLESFTPGYHAFHEFPAYGHLDVFIGKNAARDIFPVIADELAKN
jgi:pimeloyl-ACP methyl ester carboxylesterase